MKWKAFDASLQSRVPRRESSMQWDAWAPAQVWRNIITVLREKQNFRSEQSNTHDCKLCLMNRAEATQSSSTTVYLPTSWWDTIGRRAAWSDVRRKVPASAAIVASPCQVSSRELHVHCLRGLNEPSRVSVRSYGLVFLPTENNAACGNCRNRHVDEHVEVIGVLKREGNH